LKTKQLLEENFCEILYGLGATISYCYRNSIASPTLSIENNSKTTRCRTVKQKVTRSLRCYQLV